MSGSRDLKRMNAIIWDHAIVSIFASNLTCIVTVQRLLTVICKL